MSTRIAALWGSDHTELGEITVTDMRPSGAIAISRGKFRKGYPYLDPNEDAVLVATDGTSWLLAVADGHNGFDAARAAMTAVQTSATATLAGTEPEAAIALAITAAHAAIVEAAVNVDAERASSATTLVVAMVTADRVTVASFGDSMVMVIRDRKLRAVNRRSPFLDASTDPTDVQITQFMLRPGDMLLATTDGLTDFLVSPQVLARALSKSDPPGVVARQAVELAFAGGAGDNVAVAVFVASDGPNA
ncbi:MAG: protein phosphatase 2C domain-containing protein [Acidimicrobiia bacterium]|nr:protein phosphatase 2C domain-containing protein [Acidimicrobiia bacterium]